MGKAYSTLGGALSSTEGLVADLVAFKANDVSPLTLLNEEESMTPVASKVEDVKVTLEDILTQLNTQAKLMQETADYVNADAGDNLDDW